jgi:hypothetical protein
MVFNYVIINTIAIWMFTMHPFVLSHNELMKLKKYAESNIISAEENMCIARGEAPVVGNRGPYTLNVDFGYKIVYSIEYFFGFKNHADKIFKVKKLSISVDNTTKNIVIYPSPEIVTYVMSILDMGTLSECIVKLCENDSIPNILIHKIIDTIDKDDDSSS